MVSGPRNNEMKSSPAAKTLVANKPKSYELDSIKRQYSGKDYTIEDKKNVINYQINLKKA
tara:strand:+ start:1252 stop:1431 length:180 start_codon:yes stop_codon:yes gene_type:complete